MYFKFTYTCILFWQLLIISHVERAAKKSPCLSKCSSDNDQLSPKEYKTLNVKDEHQLEHSLISYLVLVKKKVILCVLRTSLHVTNSVQILQYNCVKFLVFFMIRMERRLRKIPRFEPVNSMHALFVGDRN